MIPGEDTAKKEEVLERGIAKLKIRTLLRKRSEKTKKSRVKTDQKCEAVLRTQDSSDSSTLDTSLPNKVLCSTVRFEKVPFEDENDDKYDGEFRDEKVTEEKGDHTAVACDETFELSYQEFVAEKDVARIGEATRPEPELAGQKAALENVLQTRMENRVASFEDQKSHDSGSISFPEDEKESFPEDEKECNTSTHASTELASKELDEAFDDEKSHDSGIIATSKENTACTCLPYVSAELVSKELHEEEAAQRDSDSKSQLATTTAMNPKRCAGEDINAEPYVSTVGVTQAPNLTDAEESIEHFASMLPTCQVTYDHSITTISEGVRHVFGIGGHGSEQVGDMIHGREPKHDNAVSDPHALCVDAKVELEMVAMIGMCVTNLGNPCDERCDESSCGSASADSDEKDSVFDGSFTWENDVEDFPFDEVAIEPIHMDRNAASAENDENSSIFDGSLPRSGSGDRNAALAENDENSSIFDGSILWSGSVNGSVNKNNNLNGDDMANLNENGNDSLNGNDDDAKLHCAGSVSGNSSSIKEKVPDTDVDQLLQGLANFERQNFDLLRRKARTSKGKFGLLQRFKKMKNTAKNKNGKNGLDKKTKLVAEDTNEKHAKTDATPEPLRWREDSKVEAEPFRRNKSNVEAEHLRDQESYGDSTTILENTLLPKASNASSLLGHNDPDWGSVLSPVEKDDTAVDICADDDDPSHNINDHNFDGGLKHPKPDMTGGSLRSTETEHETDEEAETSMLVDIVQIAGDSIKILETSPVRKASVDRNADSVKLLETKSPWKTALDPNTGRSYYYNRLTRETTWTMPFDLVSQ